MAKANGYLETLDRMIADVGDRVETVDHKNVADRYGREFATWLLRQGYSTRKSWRKSNAAAEARREALSSDAKDLRQMREEFLKLAPPAQDAFIRSLEKTSNPSVVALFEGFRQHQGK